MNIVVFGEDIYSNIIIESLIANGHKVLLIITPVYKNYNYKVLEDIAAKYDIDFIREEDVNSDKVKAALTLLKPDVIITIHIKKILKEEIYALVEKSAINVHPSLLPKYGGLSPQHQPILHGEIETGVTVHHIAPIVDTGEIIVQTRFPIGPNDYVMNVQTKMMTIYKTIVIEAIRLINDPSFKPMHQDLSQVSYFGLVKKADREIHLSKSREEIYNLVRAVSLPYKGAFYNEYTIWTIEIPNAKKEEELKNKYKEEGFYVDEATEEIIIKLKDALFDF
ncbi:MAG: formyltransferase family protein [Ferruginibacter sp.]